MSYLIALIVDDIEQCPAILDAWEEAGASGVTIFPSMGLGRIRNAGLRDDIPIIPNLHDLLFNEEIQHRTLLSVVKTQEMVDKMVDVTYQIIGDLDDPNTGFMFIVPVSQVYGFGKHRIDRLRG